MAGKELALRNESNLNLREMAARTTLREIHLKGHVYVDLRQVGKRMIFFCTLCLTPCYNDSVLFDHLHGSLHARRRASAMVTLLGPVPWPFSDGVLFFGNSNEKDRNLLLSDYQEDTKLPLRDCEDGMLGNDDDVSTKSGCRNLDCLASWKTEGYSLNRKSCGNTIFALPACTSGVIVSKNCGLEINCNGMPLKTNGYDNCALLCGILFNDEISDLRAPLTGNGQISLRVCEFSGGHRKISKIWCAWLGGDCLRDGNELTVLRKINFGIVIFSFTNNLGRKSGVDVTNYLLSPASCPENDGSDSPIKKAKKSFCDPEDSSGAIVDPCITSDGECIDMDSCFSDGTVGARNLNHMSTSKAIKWGFREKKKLSADRMCDICRQPMLPGKDVGTLLNLKTGNIVCQSRNRNGAFHLFHASCLVHWILLCESEIWTGAPMKKRTTRRHKRKAADSKYITSILCPECQGTGPNIAGDELEKPTIPLSRMFLYKLKAVESHKEWMRSPEVLQNCSTGLHFSLDGVGHVQEKVLPLQMIPFFRVEEEQQL